MSNTMPTTNTDTAEAQALRDTIVHQILALGEDQEFLLDFLLDGFESLNQMTMPELCAYLVHLQGEEVA